MRMKSQELFSKKIHLTHNSIFKGPTIFLLFQRVFCKVFHTEETNGLVQITNTFESCKRVDCRAFAWIVPTRIKRSSGKKKFTGNKEKNILCRWVYSICLVIAYWFVCWVRLRFLYVQSPWIRSTGKEKKVKIVKGLQSLLKNFQSRSTEIFDRSF